MNNWPLNFMKVVDSGNLDDLNNLLTQNVTLTFANNTPVSGSENLLSIFKLAQESNDRIWHDIEYVSKSREKDYDIYYVEAKANYQRDQQVIRLPVVSCLRVRSGKVFDYRIYMDPTPAF
ncbi:nuclear transport factor 2 family protein [Aeromonas veronii]